VSEQFLPGDAASGKQLKALRKHGAKTVSDAAWLTKGGKKVRVAGIGGTIRNLASAAERRAGLPYTDAQGYTISGEELDELIDELASLPVAKRTKVPGIKPDRGDVVLGGAVVLGELMDLIGADEIEATDAGLREGVFFEHFIERDPPLFENVRHASVENLANRYEQDMGHASRVAQLSLEIHEGLIAEGLAPDDDDDRELLWAACMLHDIGTAVDYSDHHKHSRYLILNAGLPGFTPRELHLIALIARYHRKGDPDISELNGLAEDGDEQRLSVLSGVIRLAEQLERSRDGSVRGVRLSAHDGTVLLEPRTRRDASVAIWSARRSSDLLERAIDRDVEIEPTRR
jgi:exopolyphosphatase/guanosine-5'-triphosphate,3'-diphosphate pyrophosphatase